MKYIISWGTDFCDDFPERLGDTEIEADSEDEAIKKFNALKIQKANIYRIEKETE